MAIRKIEIFSAGCPLCKETEELVNSLTCPSCDVNVIDMHDPSGVNRAKELGVCSVPAVAIDGKLADCCTGHGPEKAGLLAAGIGQPVS
ncbi:thioredoxin family protein [Desulfomarina sp.]